jgi:hypothetical protein
LPAGLSVSFSSFNPIKLVNNQLRSINKIYEFNRRSSSCTTMATRRSDQAMDHSHSPHNLLCPPHPPNFAWQELTMMELLMPVVGGPAPGMAIF